jgi:iron(III) transport system ATP-binding protein
MSQVIVHNVVHAYGTVPVLRGVQFALEPGAIGCLLGPSGCGKTTLLRCLAGFEPISAGRIEIAGEVVSTPAVLVPPEQRGVGVVFQDYALFPHLNVAKNVAFGLGKLSGMDAQKRTDEMLELVGLSDLHLAFPHELSGGQQQRVALARALAPAPKLILLDEPFSSLDIELRESLSAQVRTILKASGATALLVTHDQHEAFALADEIGILRDGAIEQWDAAYKLYHEPASRFVADFVGEGVFLPAAQVSPSRVETALGELTLERDIPPFPLHALEILLRPDDVIHDDASPVTAKVCSKAFRGAQFLYTLQLSNGQQVLSLVPSHHNHAIGESIGIRLEVDHVIAFQRGGVSGPPVNAGAQKVLLPSDG